MTGTLPISFVAVALAEAGGERGSITEIACLDVVDGIPARNRRWTVSDTSVVGAFEEVREWTGERFVVSHDAVYTARSLSDAYHRLGFEDPTHAYLCSLLMARREFPLADYALPVVCDLLGVPLGEAPGVAERAKATAQLVMSLAVRWRARTLDELAEAMNLRPGFMSPFTGHTTCWTRPYSWPSAYTNPCNPVFGQSLVFTGVTAIPRVEIWEWAREYGAEADERVTKRTSGIVIGDGFTGSALPEPGTSAVRKAAEMMAKGQHIAVLSEQEFVDTLRSQIVDTTIYAGPTWCDLPAWVRDLRDWWVQQGGTEPDVLGAWLEHVACPACSAGHVNVVGNWDAVTCSACGHTSKADPWASPWGPSTPRGERGTWADGTCPVCSRPRRVLDPVNDWDFVCKPREIPDELTAFAGPGAFQRPVPDSGEPWGSWSRAPAFSGARADVADVLQRQHDLSCVNAYGSASAEGWYRSMPVWLTFCHGCGALFAARTGDQEFCTKECGPMPDGYARELRRMAVAAGPKIVRSDVFTRDEWTCYLCGKKVARNAKDPLARGSLDHVIPIVLGGHHSPDNVRTTHLRCNLNKSDNYFSPTQVAALAAYMQDTQEEDTSGPDWAPADGE